MTGGMKRFPAVGSALALMMFLLPFVVISCPGGRVELTGVQLVTGTTLEQAQPFGPPKTQRIPGETLALLAVVAGAISVVFAFATSNLGALGSAASSGAAVTCLLLLKSKIVADAARDGQGLFEVSFQAGYWLSLLLFAASCGLALYVAVQATRPVRLAASAART